MAPNEVCVATCWVQLLNDAAYVSANYGHSCTALLGDLPHAFAFVRVCMKKIKSCNLNPRFCRLHRKFNSGAKGLNTSCTHYLSGYAVGICTCGYVSFVKEVIAEKNDTRFKASTYTLELGLGLE